MKIRLMALAFVAFLVVCCNTDNGYKRIEGFAQGGTYHIIYSLPDGGQPDQILSEVEASLQAIDFSLSGYNRKSILSRVNAGEDVALDSHFIKTFNLSKEVWALSEGMFDPSAAPLFDIWGFGFEDRESVTQAKTDSILAFVGMDKVQLEDRDGECHLVKSDSRVKLNFNAIAQGYTCDAVAEVLDAFGCENYLVEIGREIVCKGHNARGELWTIGLDKPVDGNMDEGENLQEILKVTDCGIVTSGNYRKFYVVDGEKFAHTINPKTGRPVTHNLLSATVTAGSGALADAFATWFMVVGPDKARELSETIEGVRSYLVFGDNDNMDVWRNLE